MSRAWAEDPPDADELSDRSTDPTRNPTSFIVQGSVVPLYFDQPDGSAVDEVGGEILYRQVTPVRMLGMDQIVRVSVPLGIGGPAGSGLKSVALFDVAIVPVSFGRLAIGGVVNYFPVPAPPVTIGPAIGAIIPAGKAVVTGLFLQTGFAVGDNPVATLLLQPILAVQLGRGWAITLGDLLINIDAYEGRLSSFPLGAQVGRVTTVGHQPMRFVLGGLYDFVETPTANRLLFTFSVTIFAKGQS
jgi:hypothetical protein